MERDTALALAIAFVVALVVTAGAVVMAVTARPSTASGLPGQATCAEWTDGCIVCRRTDQGPVCSTPGIACTRAEPRCLRRDGAE
jgi:hypothetical protein